MDSTYPNDLDSCIWQILEEELMDSPEEKLLRFLREKQMQQQEANNTTRRKRVETVIDWNREGHNQLFNDYFSENPAYTESQFRRKFRMRRHVFLRIVMALGNHDAYFQMRVDANDKMGLSPLQKCIAAVCILAYGSPTDSVYDYYVQIDESTAWECLERFVRGVNELFGTEYLRRPNNNDIERLLQMGETRGFPGMLGSINYIDWEWKNCPLPWEGPGDHGKPLIALEAVASQDLWIWHAFFGIACSNNFMNGLNQPNVFIDILEGQTPTPTVQYTVNGTQYNMGYYLANDIYPDWVTFVKTIPMPQGEKRKLFAQQQESVKKDVDEAFRLLRARFAIILGPMRAWHMNTIKHIINACIILHNMIIEDERHTNGVKFNYCYDHVNNDSSTIEVSNVPPPHFATYLQRRSHLHQIQIHRQLQADLVDHIWERSGRENNES